MATQFQNRIVGTLVLVSLGVIILPDLFDGKKKHYQEYEQAIPLRPMPAIPEQIELLPPELSESESPQKHLEVTSNLDAEDLSMPLPEPVENDVPMEKDRAAFEQLLAEQVPEMTVHDPAWIIRLGTFKNVENAQNLVEKLRSNGYPAKLVPRAPKVGEFVRVEVGPDVSREKLSGMIQDLQSLTGLKGKLIRFDPIKS